ncbi:MAG: PolC-type DNA polymerase III [Acholeplasmatales bacterium]|jgi:DNA polymerase-3 subunit alpha (Gram-positive type)|nr:PolC-type DNA polymerase III [Acholeplasmatales bacterium]
MLDYHSVILKYLSNNSYQFRAVGNAKDLSYKAYITLYTLNEVSILINLKNDLELVFKAARINCQVSYQVNLNLTSFSTLYEQVLHKVLDPIQIKVLTNYQPNLQLKEHFIVEYKIDNINYDIVTQSLGIIVNFFQSFFNLEIKFQINELQETIEEIPAPDTYLIDNSLPKEVYSYKRATTNSTYRNVEMKDLPYDLNTFNEYKKYHSTFIDIQGYLLNIEQRGKSTNLTIFQANEAILGRFWSSNQKLSEKCAKLVYGDHLTLKGTLIYDVWARDVIIDLNSIEPNKNISGDLPVEELPRVEFSVHTTMTAMNSICSAPDLIAKAAKLNIKALAFTDRNGISSYPAIYKATKVKDNPVKAIYGLEADFISTDTEFITNVQAPDILLKEAVYVFFDTETTGLSIHYDSIIEIGAIKLYPNGHKETFSKLINPGRPIPALSTKINNITDEMVKDKLTIDQELPNFLKFIEDADILVGHNVNFDINMVKEEARRLGIILKNYRSIDTYYLTKFTFEDTNPRSRFNLSAAYNKLVDSKIINGERKNTKTDFHRASYDTTIGMEVWLGCKIILDNWGISTYQAIDQYFANHDKYLYIRPIRLHLLCKNKIGFRNMFYLVSQTLTDEKSAVVIKGEKNIIPRLNIDTLKKYQEGLIIGTDHQDLLECALNDDPKILAQKIAFSDYIEVCSPQNYRHMIDDLENGSKKIEEAIQRIIKESKSQNKLVIATSDVYYLEKKDKEIREVLVRAKGLGGFFHDLHRYATLPEQHLRATSELLEEFSFLGDDLAKEIVITNTLALNEQIEVFETFNSKLNTITDDGLNEALGIKSIEKEVVKICEDNLKKRYGENPHPLIKKRYHDELSKIIKNKFCANYYLAYLIVKDNNQHGYEVGSRGSVGSSFIAMLMDITEVNPLPPHYVCPNCHFTAIKGEHKNKALDEISSSDLELQENLEAIRAGIDAKEAHCPICKTLMDSNGIDIRFETFIGLDGNKIPDIDLNLSDRYQDKAHLYIKKIIGNEAAFRAGTISTIQDRTGIGYIKGYYEWYEKRKKGLDQNDEGNEEETEEIKFNALPIRAATLNLINSKLIGAKRTTGVHAGGIVVVPKNININDITPIQFPSDKIDDTGWKTTHFDFHSFEDNLLKLDMLGHQDPTMIWFLLEYSKTHPSEIHGISRLIDIPLNDQKVISLFNSTTALNIKTSEKVATTGIPEFGTNFVKGVLIASQPQSFSDLVKLSGLTHGTNVWQNNCSDLLSGHTKFGPIPFDKIIGCRDDLMESLVIYGLKETDAFNIMEFVRKGKAVSNPQDWAKHVAIMKNKNVPEWFIWSASLIQYLFPRAHATAYVLYAVRIAWFKLYHPLVFYSAYFSIRASEFDYTSMISNNLLTLKSKITSLTMKLNEKGSKNTKKTEDLQTNLIVACEMLERGYQFLNVDIQKSTATTFEIENGALRMPFICLDGLGSAVAEDLVSSREEEEFKTKASLLNRNITKEGKVRKILNKTIFDKLNAIGALSGLVDDLDQIAKESTKETKSPYRSLFDLD